MEAIDYLTYFVLGMCAITFIFIVIQIILKDNEKDSLVDNSQEPDVYMRAESA